MTWSVPPTTWAGRTGWRASSSAGTSAGGPSGFPTANLETLPHTAIPADGVYAGWLARLDTDGSELERWPAAISVGTEPDVRRAGADPSRRTRSTATTWISTARTWLWTLSPGCGRH